MSGPVLGRFWVPETDSDEIGWIDPVTLRPRSADRAALPQQGGVWAVSPNGRLIAAAPAHGIRIVDAETLTPITTVGHRNPDVLAWLSDDLLAGVVDGETIVWDALGRQIRSFELAGHERIAAWHAAVGRLIVLVTPDADGGSGPARLLEISATTTDVLELERVVAGFDPNLGEHGTQLTPGLAYDPVAGRVFVVQPDGPIAEVELDEWSVSYHSLPSSPLEAFVTSLVPSASAKLSSWATTQAVWIGGDLLAVSGYAGDVMSGEGEAAGVTIINTEDWGACLLHAGPTNVAVTGGTLLAWGGSGSGELGGVGLLGFDLADGRQWHLFGRQYLDVQVYDGYAYAINSWNGWHVATVDVSTRRVVAELDRRPPTVLATGSLQSR